MDFLESRRNNTCILELAGKLDVTSSLGLGNKISTLIELGESLILLDCTNLEYVSSAGLRVLFEAAYNLKQGSGCMKVCSVNSNVKRVFDMVDLSSEVEVFSSKEEALG